VPSSTPASPPRSSRKAASPSPPSSSSSATTPSPTASPSPASSPTPRPPRAPLAHLKRSSCRVILVEKTDRLYRNLTDYSTLDSLDLEIHLVKEGVILSPDSKSHEKFMHGIKVLMAKNYVDNLSEEVRKGMTEKAEQGHWPSWAPIGYLNCQRRC
jgi:hypothetical protein